MAYVNPSTQSLRTCFQSRYSLPYFQREYKWEARHYEELFNDIQNSFILDFDPSDGRTEVASYQPYFLGSIITSTEKQARKPLIDGQQRLTSVFLLLAFLERYRKDNKINDAADLSTLLGDVSYGQRNFMLEMSPTRQAIFNLYLDETKTKEQALIEADDLPNKDDGDRKIIDALRATDEILDDTVRDSLPYFIDYVRERVLLIDISVESETEAQRVFVTMNDRGLRLGPIDLLKGLVLSKVSKADADICHEAWSEIIRQLREIGVEEDSLFFRNLFRAKWAMTARGKSKGDAAGDFDVISDAYHRWFEDNTTLLGLNSGDDYTKFCKVDLAKYAEIYKFIKSCEQTLTLGFECIHYNGVRRFSLQPMILLATVDVNDPPTQWQTKISLTARLLDLILTSRTIEGKTNNYDNLKEISFTLTKEVRGKNLSTLSDYIRTEWDAYHSSLSNLATLKYNKADRSDLLYLLARISCYLEDKFSLTNKTGFQMYWQRDRNLKTFDIEHLLCEKYDTAKLPVSHGFSDAKDYAESRNLLGALVLLPRGRNRSLQDLAYHEKLDAYSTENILCQSLGKNLYLNNPNVKAYLGQNKGLKMVAIDQFSKANIAERADLYIELSKLIWEKPHRIT